MSGDPVFWRRLIIAIFSLIGCGWLSAYGWRDYDGDRRDRGRILIGCAFLVGLSGMGLFWCGMFRSTWSWWL